MAGGRMVGLIARPIRRLSCGRLPAPVVGDRRWSFWPRDAAVSDVARRPAGQFLASKLASKVASKLASKLARKLTGKVASKLACKFAIKLTS